MRALINTMEKKKKVKKIKTKELWNQLLQEPYFDLKRDEKLKNQFYEHFFSVLTKEEKNHIFGIKLILNPVPRKEIYVSLANLRKNTFKHSKRRPILFDLIDRRPDGSLKCLYTDQVLEPGDDDNDDWIRLSEVGKEEKLKKSKKNIKFDEEHTFPQSYQSKTGLGTGRDMHQMFAVGKSANGKRGNKAFGVGQTIKEINQYGTYSIEAKIKFYEPKKNKSVAARAFLYIMQGYPGCVGNEKFPKGSEKWVIEQGKKENVSLWEKHRNYVLNRLQGNRNPFIDFPRLVELVDFNDSWRDSAIIN